MGLSDSPLAHKQDSLYHLHHDKKGISIFSSLGLLLAAAIWGFAFVIVKDSLDYIGAVWMLAFRFTIATLALALVTFQQKTTRLVCLFLRDYVSLGNRLARARHWRRRHGQLRRHSHADLRDFLRGSHHFHFNIRRGT